MGHIGYTPQFKKKFQVEGSTSKKTKVLKKEPIQTQKVVSKVKTKKKIK